jgi:pyridoxal 5'-phosphate synthase pdxS subunit
MRTITNEMRTISSMGDEQLMSAARDMGAPYDIVKEVAETGVLPVVNFAAGGIATPADAALMMGLGVDGVFVGSGIFKSSDPDGYAGAIVEATTFWNEPEVVGKVSRGLGTAMPGIEMESLQDSERLASRGW